VVSKETILKSRLRQEDLMWRSDDIQEFDDNSSVGGDCSGALYAEVHGNYVGPLPIEIGSSAQENASGGVHRLGDGDAQKGVAAIEKLVQPVDATKTEKGGTAADYAQDELARQEQVRRQQERQIAEAERAQARLERQIEVLRQIIRNNDQQIAHNDQQIAHNNRALVENGLTRIPILMKLGRQAHSTNPITMLGFFGNHHWGSEPASNVDRELEEQVNSIRSHLTDAQLQPVVDYFTQNGRMIPGVRQLTGHMPASTPDTNMQRAIDLRNFMRNRR
jgi:hypothetical protein